MDELTNALTGIIKAVELSNKSGLENDRALLNLCSAMIERMLAIEGRLNEIENRLAEIDKTLDEEYETENDSD